MRPIKTLPSSKVMSHQEQRLSLPWLTISISQALTQVVLVSPPHGGNLMLVFTADPTLKMAS